MPGTVGPCSHDGMPSLLVSSSAGHSKSPSTIAGSASSARAGSRSSFFLATGIKHELRGAYSVRQTREIQNKTTSSRPAEVRASQHYVTHGGDESGDQPGDHERLVAVARPVEQKARGRDAVQEEHRDRAEQAEPHHH